MRLLVTEIKDSNKEEIKHVLDCVVAVKTRKTGRDQTLKGFHAMLRLNERESQVDIGFNFSF